MKKNKPRLKYVACHRQRTADALRKLRGLKSLRSTERIYGGPLRGCWRLRSTANVDHMNVFLFKRDYVLEFRHVIRIEP